MRKLTKPPETAQDVFVLCVNGIEDTNLKTRLLSCKKLVEDAAVDYDTKKVKQELHLIAQNKSTKASKNTRLINGQVTINEMKAVYTDNFVPKTSPGRPLYDKLMMAPPLGICPYCLQRIVTTLDHFLPKAYYPLLSVAPVNLVPSCTDCNKDKLSAYPRTSGEECIHPYYDDIENEQWLKAEVIQSKPATISFFVDPPKSWPPLLIDRVRFHFKTYQLGKLYATQAAVLLINLQALLVSIHKKRGAIGVKSHLKREAKSRKAANKNSWQTATYTAMALDDWFCNGGFK